LGTGEARDARSFLLEVETLHRRRAPGNTCLAALASGRVGTRAEPLNNSKGCGGVMRVAPVALCSAVADGEVFDLACDAAAITHGHPTGWLAAGALAVMLRRVLRGDPLVDAALGARERVAAEPHARETTAAIDAALELWRSGMEPTVEAVESLGAGWVAEEALAIGLYGALVGGPLFDRGVLTAVNHSGDSDSTGSIAGQLLGAVQGEGPAELGCSGIPGGWHSEVEHRDLILAVADDLAVGYREGEAWWARYPGT
jgi:ADP-ribosylglycohydrolase